MSKEYSKLTVIQLKAELRKRNLPVGGLKKDLIERLEGKSQSIKKVPVKRPSSTKVSKTSSDICGDFLKKQKIFLILCIL